MGKVSGAQKWKIELGYTRDFRGCVRWNACNDVGYESSGSWMEEELLESAF